MGVLPLQFKDENRNDLALTGEETFDIAGIAEGLKPGQDINMTVHYPDGSSKETTLLCRIDTLDEMEYYRNGGILHYVLRQLAA